MCKFSVINMRSEDNLNNELSYGCIKRTISAAEQKTNMVFNKSDVEKAPKALMKTLLNLFQVK